MLCGKKLYIYKHTSESQTAVVPYPDTQFTKQYPNDLAFNTDDLKKICLESEYECLCIIHNVKCWAEWITSWNLDCWKKYKQPQICRWCFFNDKKWKGTTGPLDEGESEEWKSWFKTQHQKNKIMESSSITSWQVEEEKVEAVTGFLFLGFNITTDGDCSHEIRRQLLLGRKALTIWTFVSKMMPLLFNTLSRFVIAFLTRHCLVVLYYDITPTYIFCS